MFQTKTKKLSPYKRNSYYTVYGKKSFLSTE